MFEYEKRIIGYLIRYYRLKNKIYASDFIAYKSEQMNRYCINCKRKCKNKETIASHKTLEKIERGITSRKECLYFDFVYKLGMNYDITLTNIKKINYFEKELLQLVLSKKKEGMLRYQKNLRNLKKSHDGIIYFYDLIEIFYSVTELEISNKLCDLDLLAKMEYLLKYVKDSTKKIILYYLIRYYTQFYNEEKYKTYLKEASKVFTSNIEFQFSQKAIELNALDMLMYLQHFDKLLLKEANLLIYLWALALVYEKLHKYDLALTCIEKGINFCINEKILDTYLYRFYMRRGIVMYQMGQFQLAYESFLKVYLYNIDCMGTELILFFHCYELLRRSKDIHLLLSCKKAQSIHVDSVKAIFVYYRMKYLDSFSKKELVNYILCDLRNYLELDSLCEKVIREDLLILSAKTRYYKRLFSYFSD